MIVQTFQREFNTLADDKTLFNALIQATAKAGATIFATGKHEFSPCGFTAFVILGESHSALHSFPEKSLVWVELATCKDEIDVDRFFEVFSKMI